MGDEIITVVDATDVLFLPCGRDIHTEFIKFHAGIVLSGNSFQWPDGHKEAYFPEAQQVDATSFPNTAAEDQYKGCK